MRSKILTGAAALSLAISGLATTAPASAQSWPWNRGDVGADLAVGVVGGGLATATLPFWAPGYYGYYDGYYPGYVDAPDYAYIPRYRNAPLYAYFGAYDWDPWIYRGGPHPR